MCNTCGIKKSKKSDLEEMVDRMELFYDEIVDILEMKYTAGSTNGDTLPPGINLTPPTVILPCSNLCFTMNKIKN